LKGATPSHESVPKFAEALSGKPPAIRKYAALALGEMGGVKAKEALGHALLSEQDEEVAVNIKIALRPR
jgi:HEAT repeat protein